MVKLQVIILFSLLFVAKNLHASGWSGAVVVEEIYALNETESIIKLSSFTNPDECQVTSAGHVIINPSVNKAWFSMLLTAYTTKSKVNIFVTGCSAVWENTTFAKVGHIKFI